MSLVMTVEEREAFLADLHVGVVSVAGEDGRAPLAVPIWYRYEPGGLLSFVTGRTSRKTRALRETGRCSFCVQREARPYRYVTVEGPVVAIDPVDPAELHEIRRRYLGADAGDASVASESEVMVRMRPEHWLSADYGKLDR